MMNEPMPANEYMRNLRSRLQWTQQDLAHHLFASPATVAAWEQGRNPIPGSTFRWMEAVHSVLDDAEQLGVRYLSIPLLNTNTGQTRNTTLSISELIKEFGLGTVISNLIRHDRKRDMFDPGF